MWQDSLRSSQPGEEGGGTGVALAVAALAAGFVGLALAVDIDVFRALIGMLSALPYPPVT